MKQPLRMKNTSQQKRPVSRRPTEAHFNSPALISLALKEFQGLWNGMLGRETELLSPGFLWLFIMHHHRHFPLVWAEDLHRAHLNAVGAANTPCPVHPEHHQALILKVGQETWDFLHSVSATRAEFSLFGSWQKLCWWLFWDEENWEEQKLFLHRLIPDEVPCLIPVPELWVWACVLPLHSGQSQGATNSKLVFQSSNPPPIHPSLQVDFVGHSDFLSVKFYQVHDEFRKLWRKHTG